MKPWFLLFSAALVLVACRPADYNTTSVRQRVLGGEMVTLSKPGTNLCGKKAWTEMRLSDMDERTRVVLSQQASTINPGHSVCYQVGDTVSLSVLNRQINQGGTVRIDSISLVLYDRLRSSQLQGSYFASDTAFNTYRDAIKGRLKPDQEGIVTIANFTYLPGSAVDEAALRQADKDQNQGDGYVETANDGEYLPGVSCKSPRSFISIPADLEAQFADGTIKTWYALTDSLCLTQGQEADLSKAKGAPATAHVRVTKLKRFKLSAVSKYFPPPAGMTADQLQARIAQDNTHSSQWITVIEFGGIK